MDNEATSRSHYVWFSPITTRWMDNDVYGHVNNVTYYSFFDTAVNHYLIKHGGLDIHNAPIVGYVVHSTCNYQKPIAYPDEIEVGIKVQKLGNSSVTYSVALFKVGEAEAAAYGSFVHVFVNRAENRSAPIPTAIRNALQCLTN